MDKVVTKLINYFGPCGLLSEKMGRRGEIGQRSQVRIIDIFFYFATMLQKFCCTFATRIIIWANKKIEKQEK